ncbi:hypothetical protein GlitD10_0956 [Gloeomargarita lithophora Alchichica-D10]|uniref:Uncharacterized protein n=1 Tax=Gloeomargarita lithophora Alchichica-D10 TaxID=1188229 RepID=A0A1J0ABG1_9CYAN|nr:hypothetical protein [Gloeomargarita lithophora]APB33274.1 hypothetical protein GlitD10_0956 [Gloeomargarita lithophora Alchichica-D10]
MTSKPSRFSDPYSDWHGCENLFKDILDQEPIDLNVKDYRVIFARHLPAADYREGLYYIPHCLDYIRRGQEHHTSRYPDSLLWWIKNYQQHFESDGQWENVLQAITQLVLDLLTSFVLFDLSEQQCADLGRDFDYSIGPYNQITVHEMLDDLTIWTEYAGVLEALIAQLKALKTVNHARWYVELAAHSRIWCLLYDPSTPLDNYANKERLFHELHTFESLQKAEEIARSITHSEGKSKYNKLVLL